MSLVNVCCCHGHNHIKELSFKTIRMSKTSPNVRGGGGKEYFFVSKWIVIIYAKNVHGNFLSLNVYGLNSALLLRHSYQEQLNLSS